MFLSKKIIAALLSPFVLSVIALGIGVFLAWCNRARKLQLTLLTLGFVALLVLSFNTAPSWLLASLESQYPPILSPPNAVNTIVVLGGGVRDKTDVPPNTQLGASSLARLVEGVRLYQLLKEQQIAAKLVLSGGRVFGSPSDAGVMRNTAVILGVDPKDIILESGSKDTYEEAIYLKKTLKDQPFLLVTSAFHMPRSMALFQAQGMRPIAAPTQFLAKQNQFSIVHYFPNGLAITQADIALHEYIGIVWAHLIKQI